MSDTQTSLAELLEEETRRSRQVRARLESIALAGEVLRVMLGRGNLADAVQTLLAGVVDAEPCRRVLLFEVGGDGMREIGRAGDGADGPGAVEPLRIPAADDSLAWQCVRRGRHLLIDSAPLPEGGEARGGAWLFPFEGRLGDIVDGGGRASHLLWIDRPDTPVPEGATLDFLLSLTGQAGVLLTGFRYRDDLQRTYEELRVANNHLQRDIDRARRIQEALLPRDLPRRPGLMAASRYLPAAKVGGDYFDCFPADPADPEGVQTLVIADVSGHGISAAMVMAMFKVLLRREAQRSSSPAGILERLNSVLRDNIHGLHYVTVFLAFHDPRRGRLVYATAGHCPPLLIRGGAVIDELRGDGLFLGVFDSTGAVEKTLDLEVGDDLLLYTDGITEAESAGGEFFGLDRLKEAVRGGGDPDALLGRLLESWRGFASGATLQDDVTLLAIGL